MEHPFSHCDLTLSNIKQKASLLMGSHPKYFLSGIAKRDSYLHIRSLPEDAVYVAIAAAQILHKHDFGEMNQAMKILLKIKLEVIYKLLYKDPKLVTMELVEQSLKRLYKEKVLKYHSIQFVEKVEKYIKERYTTQQNMTSSSS